MKIRGVSKRRKFKGGASFMLTWHLRVGDVGSEGVTVSTRPTSRPTHFSRDVAATSCCYSPAHAVYPKSNLANPPGPWVLSPIPSAIYEGKQAEDQERSEHRVSEPRRRPVASSCACQTCAVRLRAQPLNLCPSPLK